MKTFKMAASTNRCIKVISVTSNKVTSFEATQIYSDIKTPQGQP